MGIRWPKPKPPTPAPLPRLVSLRVIDAQGQGIVGAEVLLVPDDGAADLQTADVNGRVTFAVTATGGAEIDADATGYVSPTERVVLPPMSTDGPIEGWPGTLMLQSLVVVLSPLRVQGKFFEQIDGTPWLQIGCSDFRIFQRLLAGEDIRPILKERRDLGFNQLRIFGMCDLMFRLYPQEFGERYWTSLVELAALLESYALYLEFVVFVDAGRVMPNPDDQRRHWKRFCEVVTA